jgi:hypothetical protein
MVEARRLRVIAATLLGVGCTSVGFIAGWHSARAIHAGDSGAVISGRVASPPTLPSQPVQHSIINSRPDLAGSEKTELEEGRAQARSALAMPKTEADNSQKLEQPVEEEPALQQERGPTSHGVRLVNPDAGRVNSAAGAPVAVSDRADHNSNPQNHLLDQCARRYSSFRRNDGTYQPLDGGPRKLCSLLR